MRLFSIPPPTLLAGFLAVLIGYASSAAIIWQAAIVAGATTAQISGWMTALGLAMGVSTLTLTLWYRVPVLTAWSTPGAALLVTGLQGLTLNEAIGVFIVTNVLIVLCGITGLFARLMRIIPHSLAAAMLAGILLRFGLQAFASLDGQFTLCGSMLLVWLATRAVAPRYAVIAAMIIGVVIVIAQGDVVTTDVVFKPVLPTYISPDFSFAHSTPPFSGDDGIAKRTGYRSNESRRIFGSCFAINCIYWIAGTGFFPFRRLFRRYCGNHRGYLPKPGSASG
ncbi:Benzoate transport protein [Escherichia coli]